MLSSRLLPHKAAIPCRRGMSQPVVSSLVNAHSSNVKSCIRNLRFTRQVSTLSHPTRNPTQPKWPWWFRLAGAVGVYELYQNTRNLAVPISKLPYVDRANESASWAHGLFSTSPGIAAKSVEESIVMISSAVPNGQNWLHGHGTGIVLSSHGHVLTNAHCLHPHLSHSLCKMLQQNDLDVQLTVSIAGKEYPARILGFDGFTDLAVVKIDSSDKFTPASFSQPSSQQILDMQDALCMAATKTGVQTALVANLQNKEAESLGRWEKRANYFTGITDSVFPGFSGGPLVANGAIVGMTTFVDGFNVYAISMTDQTMELVRALVVSSVAGLGLGGIARPWVGIKLESTRQGAVIRKVAPFSPASKAGLRPGDIVTSVNGEKVSSAGQAMQRLHVVPKGSCPEESIHLSIQREAKLQTRQIEADLNAQLLEGRFFRQRVQFLA